MSNQINHIELAESRLATQFRESTNLINYIKALLTEADTLEQIFQDILSKRWIDTAEGVNLDILGSIVGQPRLLVNATALFYFGFDTASGAQSFGTLSDPGIGSRFRSADESTTGDRELTDEEYRVFIRARITKNSIIPTVPEMTDFLKFVLGISDLFIIDGSMFYIIYIGRPLSVNEKAFLLNTDLIPKVAAVNASYLEYDPDSIFGFNGIPNALGFGSVSNPAIGGKFASIIS